MVGFYLNESLVVADACQSSNHKCIWSKKRKYVSLCLSHIKLAIDLVKQSIVLGQFRNSYHHFYTLAIFTLLFLYLNSPYFLFTCSLLSCQPIQQHLQSTSSFILVLGKANVKRAQSCIGGRQNLSEYLFFLQLLVGFDTLTYRKLLQSPILVGYQDLFLAPLPGTNSVG